MNWESQTRWAWRPERVTRRKYPAHGSEAVKSGKLKGSTETDYFHFDCPACDRNEAGLDVELLGVRDESESGAKIVLTIILGLSCPFCKMTDIVKIGPLETEEYQRRRTQYGPGRIPRNISPGH